MDDDYDILTSPTCGPRPAHLQRRRSSGGCDRFIPTRSNLDVDLAHFQLLYGFSPEVQNRRHQSLDSAKETPDNFRRRLRERRGSNSDTNKLLNFNDVRMQDGASGGVFSPGDRQKVMLTSSRKFVDRSEDVVQFTDNAVDTMNVNPNEGKCFDISCQNTAAIGIDDAVWVCSSLVDTTRNFDVLAFNHDCCCMCLAWSPDGNKLVVGTSHGEIKVIDIRTRECIRCYGNLSPDDFPVSLSWSNNTFCGGSHLGYVWITDVRHPGTEVQRLQCDKNARQGRPALDEITTVKYSPDGCHIACGDAQGNLAIWDCNNNHESVMKKKVVVDFPCEHGVRDITWDPLQPNLLAAGVGSREGKGSIVMWNASLGLRKKSFPSESQVNSLAWSKVNNEIISGHGEQEKCVIIWKYPSMRKIFQFNGHTSPVGKVVTDSENSHIYSLSENGTLRIWKYPRAVTRTRSRSIAGTMRSPPSLFSMDLGSCIR